MALLLRPATAHAHPLLFIHADGAWSYGEPEGDVPVVLALA